MVKELVEILINILDSSEKLNDFEIINEGVDNVVFQITTLENETITTIRREDEMGAFKRPRKLFKTIVDWSYCNDNEHYFQNMTVTRIR